jgi:hypothetical protein
MLNVYANGKRQGAGRSCMAELHRNAKLSNRVRCLYSSNNNTLAVRAFHFTVSTSFLRLRAAFEF